MDKVKRIHIMQDDARRLAARFWTLNTDRVDFKVVFHRANEILDTLIMESPGRLMMLTMSMRRDNHEGSAHYRGVAFDCCWA
jgi:hypothetical protein